MEKLRKDLQIRVRWMIAGFILLAITDLVFMMNQSRLPVIPAFISGYQLGIFIEVEAILVIFIVKYKIAMKSDGTLKKMHIKETDERKLMIRQRAGSKGIIISYTGLVFATVIAGYFNEIVFLTLLGAIVFTGLVMIFLKLYYIKKY
jgi:hypothetical protein